MTEPSTTAMSAEQYSASHPPGIGRSYWHVARNRILWTKVRPSLRAGSRVLDIGCGPGIVVQYLRGRGVDCFGSDLGTPAPEEASVTPYLHLGQSAFELDPGFRAGVDILLLMDVLEHLPEPAAFLRQCTDAFPNVRAVHLTVPARMEIWSNYDEYFGHFRRYTRSMVRELGSAAGYRVSDVGYAFHGLYAAARVAKLITDSRNTKLSAPSVPLVHSLLGMAFELEQRVLPASAKGSSIFATLERVA
jgi:SAM-dependent methyltransferase